MTEKQFNLILTELKSEVTLWHDCMRDCDGDGTLRGFYITKMTTAEEVVTEFKLKYPEYVI